MTTSTITAFESTLHKSNAWMHELQDELKWEESHSVYHGFRAVLHALRDRLSVAEASDLAAQLPTLLRGVYYENWQPMQTPTRERTREQFLKPVFDAFAHDQSVDPEQLVRAVFTLLSRHISAGEIEDVKAALPEKIRELWP